VLFAADCCLLARQHETTASCKPAQFSVLLLDQLLGARPNACVLVAAASASHGIIVAADVLAEPFGGVLFAGEAASDKPATVLGAYLSGKREAERLLQLLNPAPCSGNSTTTVNATGGPL
jgi:hypothetical protein